MFRIVTSMTQQRTFPENVRRATSDTARRPSLHPCPECGRQCIKAKCFRCAKAPANPPIYKQDIDQVLEWARDLRTEQAIEAYARKKVAA